MNAYILLNGEDANPDFIRKANEYIDYYKHALAQREVAGQKRKG